MENVNSINFLPIERVNFAKIMLPQKKLRSCGVKMGLNDTLRETGSEEVCFDRVYFRYGASFR